MYVSSRCDQIIVHVICFCPQTNYDTITLGVFVVVAVVVVVVTITVAVDVLILIVPP